MLRRSWEGVVEERGVVGGASVLRTEPAVKPGKTARQESAAAQENSGSKFMRVVRDKDDEVAALETSIVSYQGKNAQGEKIQVDLVGAVHIGDKPYYAELNKSFRDYEVVLYELVAPKGARPGRGAAGAWSPIANMLSLDDQILLIDYEQDNFVHADMSWDQMMESMEKRQESFLNMFFRMMGQGIAQESTKKPGAGDGDLLAGLLFSKNPALTWKRIMAAQFEDSDQAMKWLEGPDGSTLISERNKVALEVLAEQISAGKKKIAVFYGAGHLPDMERRLKDDFKLQPGGEPRWLKAWDLSDK